MSTLFLSSSGLRNPIIASEFLKTLPKPPKELKLTHIFTASKVKDDTAFVEKDRKAFQEIGFNVQELDLEDKNREILRELLKDTDIVYMQGGNGFYLLKHIRESGFDTLLPELLEKRVIYFGTSAGSYITCPTIEMHRWSNKKIDTFGITDISGLNLIPFLISVHYDQTRHDLIKDGIEHTSLPVRILTDDQALLIQEGNIKLVGAGPEVIL